MELSGATGGSKCEHENKGLILLYNAVLQDRRSIDRSLLNDAGIRLSIRLRQSTRTHDAIYDELCNMMERR